MDEIDIYYRAFLDYRKVTANERECLNWRSVIAASDTANDNITVTRAKCTVDDDWVNAIEDGLEYIERSIKEERQFIRSEGEVVPIEKVRRVSKDSVKHLAKHCNLITDMKDDGDIVIESLYTVERDSDFAVYENRFLYMLLCYLRDFVTIRYNKILEATNKYDGKLTLNKNVTAPKHTLKYTLTLSEERKDDKYLRDHNPAKIYLERIDLILKTIVSFLSTPLMESVAKVAMIKPPITKTNVLKMDKNFKGAVALYDFIIAYDKPGYTIEQVKNELSPLKSDVADEISESVALSAFLAYEHGLGIKSDLKERYEAEEERRKVAELSAKKSQLRALSKKLAKSEISVEEYVLSLEKQNKSLLTECEKIPSMVDELEKLRLSERALNDMYRELLRKNDKLKAELAAQEIRHKEDIARLNEEHSKHVASLNEAHARELYDLNQKHLWEISELKSAHAEELRAANEAYAKEIERIGAEFDRKLGEAKAEFDRLVAKEREDHATRISEINEQIREANEVQKNAITAANKQVEKHRKMLDLAVANYKAIAEERTLAKARVKTLLHESGKLVGDFTTKENFDELEREFEVFSKFYKLEWKKTKKAIRSRYLNKDALKSQQIVEEEVEVPVAELERQMREYLNLGAKDNYIDTVKEEDATEYTEPLVSAVEIKPVEIAVIENALPDENEPQLHAEHQPSEENSADAESTDVVAEEPTDSCGDALAEQSDAENEEQTVLSDE